MITLGETHTFPPIHTLSPIKTGFAKVLYDLLTTISNFNL